MKINLSKFNFALLLSVLLVIILLLEVLVLVKTFSPPSLEIDLTQSPQQETRLLKLDVEGFDDAVEWAQERGAYTLPNYNLDQGSLGRENPMTEF